METHSVSLSLHGFGQPPAQAEVVVGVLGVGERLKRGLVALAAGIGVALVALPIPIVHLVLPPIALLAGIGFGARRLGQREIVILAQGACPFCGTAQRLGLTGSAFRLPRKITCSTCLKPLSLEVPDER